MSSVLKQASANDPTIDLPPPQAPGPQDGLPSVEDFIEPVRRFWWVIVLAVILSVTAGAVLTRFMPKEYSAQATLILGSEAPRFLGDETKDVQLQKGPRTRFEYAQYLETQLHVIASRPVIERVVERLKLADDDTFLGISPESTEPPPPRSSVSRRPSTH